MDLACEELAACLLNIQNNSFHSKLQRHSEEENLYCIVSLLQTLITFFPLLIAKFFPFVITDRPKCGLRITQGHRGELLHFVHQQVLLHLLHHV